MQTLVAAIFAAAAAPRETTLDAFERVNVARAASLEKPIDRALVGGALADRIGFAFAAGYDAAVAALVPELPRARRGLCVTEEGGGHPRAIRTTLESEGDALVLRGEKRWATLALRADELLVVATRGKGDAGRSLLSLVRVDTRAPGVRITPMPETPFAPEIVHATVALEGVRVSPERVLPGDGYERYVKPFRTVEDLHVHAALLGYLVGVARRNGWDAALVERALALVVTTRALAAEDPSDPAAHLALAGLLAEMRAWIEGAEPALATIDPDERARFTRDRALFEIAGKAREARRARAWERMG